MTDISALSYQSEVGISFTFNPTISISLSASDLIISNLTPGTTSDSNSINVNVATNNAYGYSLYASVGNSTYNNTNLTHTNEEDSFSSIATNVYISSLDTDNTWGYSYSIDNGTSWTPYNGLALYSSNPTRINKTTEPSSDNINFKIAAKSGPAQASGDYNNVINFTAVTKLAPLSLTESYEAYYTKTGKTKLNGYYVMQDMDQEICENAEIVESELQVIDNRDNKIYWIAKLRDDHCWMTQNLDFDLSHEVALNSETSDINPESFGQTIYTTSTGYSKNENTGVVSWLPSTIDSEGIQRADTIDMIWDNNTATIPGWSGKYNVPYSANPGDRYRYTNSSYVEKSYSSLENCAAENSDNILSCKHGHYGNYYNWSAAVASNNTAGFGAGVFENSICPKNWSLPSPDLYGAMLRAQDVWSGTGSAYTDNGFNNFRIAPLYFARFTFLGSGISYEDRGWDGQYWVNALAAVNFGARLYFYGDKYISPDSNINKSFGLSVRCLAR